MRTTSPLSPLSSPEASVGSTGTPPSPSQSVFTKLKRRLSPKKSDYKDYSPTSAKPIASSINTHTPNPLSINPKAPKCAKFERVFQFFDEDGDGKISPTELQSCMKTIGSELTSNEAASVVESLDSDGDGLLGIEDFAKLMEANGEEEENKDLREAFAMYEMEGMGCITPTSLNRTLGRLGDSKTVEECSGIIRAFDLNGDGVLSFEEFRVMMR